jgi:stearoyl-CoA desaturase (Delta-9 desaturase)
MSSSVPAPESQAKSEAQREWDQTAHLAAEGTDPDLVPGQEDVSSTRGGSDPFPFHADPWYAKATVLSVVFLPLIALGYAIFRLWGNGIGSMEVGLLVGFWAFTGLGISVGYHRMLTHRAIDAKAPARFMLLVAGAMSLQGPPADWAATHIRHHAKADREGDPHSPLEGFWHAHTAWLVRDRFVREGLAHDKLMADPVTAFIQKTWALWVLLSFGLPALLGFLITGSWWGALDGLVWGGLLRVFIGHHITWSVNSVTHMFGTRPFKTTDRATNNWLIGLIGWGEGWHNNHHAFPRAAFIGMRWYQIDFGGWLIVTLKGLGQIKSIWMPTKEERLAKRRNQKALKQAAKGSGA